MTTAPLNACATRSLHAYSAYGPVAPKPVIATTVSAPRSASSSSRSMPQSARLRKPGRLDHEVDTVERAQRATPRLRATPRRRHSACSCAGGRTSPRRHGAGRRRVAPPSPRRRRDRRRPCRTIPRQRRFRSRRPAGRSVPVARCPVLDPVSAPRAAAAPTTNSRRERLLHGFAWPLVWRWANIPASARSGSPSGGSTFTTSAPRSAKALPHHPRGNSGSDLDDPQVAQYLAHQSFSPWT